MYNPKSKQADEFINHEEIMDTLAYAHANRANRELISQILEKAKERMISFNGLKAAVLGLTFKSGTDDLREAPSIDNLKLLLAAGAQVYAYDPKGEERAKQLFPEGRVEKGTMNYVSSPEEAIDGANICFIFTEWQEVKDLPAETYRKLMKKAIILDGRNCYEPKKFEGTGVVYDSVGRSVVQ